MSEIIQLRKEDVTKVGDHWIARITPDAGTVKSGGYRDVPLHRQIINEGFAEFVEASDTGPLFHNATDQAKFRPAAVIVSNKLSDMAPDTQTVAGSCRTCSCWCHAATVKHPWPQPLRYCTP